jgi:hypothetical protein
MSKQLELAEERVRQAEREIACQLRIIQDLRGEGHSTLGAETLLRLLQKALLERRETLRLIQARQP